MGQRDFVAPFLLIISSLAGLADYLLPIVFVWRPEISPVVQTFLFALAVAEYAPDFTRQGNYWVYQLGKILSAVAIFGLVTFHTILVPFLISIIYFLISLNKSPIPTSAKAIVRFLAYVLLTSFLVGVGDVFSPVFEILLFIAGMSILFKYFPVKKPKTSLDSQMVRAIGDIIYTPFLTVLSAVLLATIFISLSYSQEFFTMLVVAFLPNFLALFVGSPVAAVSAVANILFLFIISFYFAYLLVGVSEIWIPERSLEGNIPGLYGTAIIPIFGYIFTRLPHHNTGVVSANYSIFGVLASLLGIILLLVYSSAIFPPINRKFSYTMHFTVPSDDLVSGKKHLTISLFTMFLYISYLVRDDVLLMVYFAWLLWFPVLWVRNSGVAGRTFWVLVMVLLDILFIQSGQGGVADHIMLGGVVIRNVGILGIVCQIIEEYQTD
ncbi:uncharacterized protein HHUB_2026 [Halobacterium hubeiense]|uniref:Uncharacterized protein n=1 Tax=Halobacterium hubeiense TaxID=1407499 RepID=A0A0U5H344_9EURY|nr:hypothetical protein [Halobacterium hubeiense]CQH53957.1 uncharacterized protein HHUB_2026 [Halobacterium hubeiense]